MDYLVHHGIQGQKWGVRRYQNLDGSYTDAGQRRRAGKLASISATAAFNRDVKKTKFAGNTSYEKDSKEFDKKANAQAAAGLNKTGDAVGKIRQSRKEKERANAQQKALDDAKNMTDAQLKERTARLNLENNYVNAISQQQVNAGSDNVDRILAYTAAAFGIAASAVSIYGMFKK